MAAELRKASNPRFLALLSLLSEMFAKFRIDGEPLHILPAAIISLLKKSLDSAATDEELECATTEVIGLHGSTNRGEEKMYLHL